MKKQLMVLLCAGILTITGGCVVSESDYQQVQTEKAELQKELTEARQENRILNDSVLEVYKEREKLQAQIQDYETKIKELTITAPENETGQSAAEPKYYVVKSGDTLAKISNRTNVPIDTLRSLNKTQNDIVWVGQKLRLN